MQRGNWQQALQLLDSLPQPLATEHCYQKGLCHANRADYHLAISEFEKVLKVAPRSPQVLSDLGNCLRLAHEPKRAKEHLSQALKIDRNFVCDMLKNPQDQDIVEGVIRLAQAINRPVVAEGVESIELGIMLLQLGCQYAQGYGIAKPMPADQIFPWYDRFSRKSSWTTLHNQQFSQTRAYDLNVAIFTHQIWLEKIKDYLHSGLHGKHPLLDGETCQFSCWYTGIGQYRYGSHSLFKSLSKIHTEVHEHASKMVYLANNGELDKALSMIEELDEKGTELIYILTKIAQDND